MKILRFVFATILVLIVGFDQLAAQIPRTLSYQGVLTDAEGNPRDGDQQLTFCLYTSSAGGTPIWCETKTLPVRNGLFSTVLGEQTPFGAAVKFDQQYWLGIQVGNEPELAPRIALTSVGYSFSSLHADTASVSVASLADTTWRHSGANIYRPNGNVGIGTTGPANALQIGSMGGTGYSGNELAIGDGTNVFAIDVTSGRTNFYANGNYTFVPSGGTGNVGIGVTVPEANLHVRATPEQIGLMVEGRAGQWGATIGGNGTNGASYGLQVTGGTTASDVAVRVTDALNTRELFRIRGDGNVGIGTTNPEYPLVVNGDAFFAGTTSARVLEIRGGSDLAEPFEISESQPIPKGALVIIDEENPGQLKLSHQAYDKRVAGVVSGAGGINPGLTLTQQGVMEGGQNVALSGRVYALATAANGPIKPGDLLTTSDVPGHAMKATDRELWPGAVIGKAMSGLEKGEGLVLVLVNLQ